MAQDEVANPCDNRDTCDTGRPSASEIRAALAMVARDMCGGIGRGEALASGWYRLCVSGFGGGGLADEAAEALVFRTKGVDWGGEWNLPPDPWAFDAACWAAGHMIRSGAALPPALRDFAADVLTGERERPKATGRPRRTEAADLTRAALALALVGLEWLPLFENTARKPGAKANLNAARLVAEAVEAAGHPTTPGRVKALCATRDYETLRAGIEALGIVARAQSALREAVRHVRDTGAARAV